MSLNIIQHQNAIGFCALRNSPETMAQLIRSNPGLVALDQLAAHLQRSEYIPVLTALWSERDRPKRLEWHAGLCRRNYA